MLAVCIALSLHLGWADVNVPFPEDFVNLLAGASGERNGNHRSKGNTLPLVAMPWGFNHWAPQTSDPGQKTSWWFDPDEQQFYGLRCTHQPSPWMGDYGWFLLAVSTGLDKRMGFTSYRAQGALRPHMIDLTLGPSGHRLQLTPTNHGAMLRVTFPEWSQPQDRRLCVMLPKGFAEDPDENRSATDHVPSGVCRETDGGIDLESRRFAGGAPSNFTFFGRLQSSGLPVETAPIGCVGKDCADLTPRECCFLSPTQQVIEVKIGTSFISAAQARRALEAEANVPFDALVSAARSAWQRELGRVEVLEAGPPTAETFRRLEIFYSSLYRALLFPRRLDEATPRGVQHWSPYSGSVVDGIGVSDNGFWDTFRTVYPFLSIAYPTALSTILQGWLNAFKAGGWLPKWASPGYRDMMVGTYADVVLADAIVKNISGFDQDLAWKALHRDAYEEYTADTSRGKTGLAHYKEHGFVPVDVGIAEACSRTLDFAFADAACAAAAQRLGKLQEATELRLRSRQALRRMYDPRRGLMGRPKQTQDFVEMSPETWGFCYTEGSAWQHSFPPFDLELLVELHGGPGQLLQKLEDMFRVPAYFETGSYQAVIHEMREMLDLGMGQYAHNNQPVHHVPYLFAMLGMHNATAKLVRQILAQAYSPDGYAGDEDNGEMGSWYVLSALGLYDPAPGVNEDYVLGAMPLFKRVRLHELGVTIEAPSAAGGSPQIEEVLWHSRRLSAGKISYSDLRSGGILRFVSPGQLDGAAAVLLRGGSKDSAMMGASTGLVAVIIAALAGVMLLRCWRKSRSMHATGHDRPALGDML